MTTQKLFKRRVRERQSKTGESYTAARRHVARTRDRLASARTDLAGATELASDARISEVTGRELGGVALPPRPMGRPAAEARGDGRLPDRRARRRALVGADDRRRLRAHPRPAAQAPAAGRVHDLRVEDRRRADRRPVRRIRRPANAPAMAHRGSMSLRTSQPGKVASFDWGGGPTRVLVTFDEKGPRRQPPTCPTSGCRTPTRPRPPRRAWKHAAGAPQELPGADRCLSHESSWVGLPTSSRPRWHDGRLWFAHWGTDEIIAVDLDGTSEVVGHGPGGLGWSIDWLPDGRLLVTGARGSCARSPTAR